MSAESSHRAKLILCFAIIYLVWGSTYLVASIGVHVLPPLLFGGVRFLCAGALLAIAALAMRKRMRLTAAEWRQMIVVALGSVLIPNGCTNWAMQTVASNQAAILNASAALWIALFATQGRRAHALDRRTLAGLVIGLAGTLLLIWPKESLQASHFGMQALILLAVFVWAMTTVYIRNLHSKLELLPFSAVQMFLGGLMMTGVGIARGEAALWHWTPTGLGAMAYLTVFSSCIAYTAYSWLAKHTTPAAVGTYSYVNPAIAALLGWWFLDEKLGANQLIGMAVMFAGVALVSWPQKEVKRLDEDQKKDPSTAGCG